MVEIAELTGFVIGTFECSGSPPEDEQGERRKATEIAEDVLRGFSGRKESAERGLIENWIRDCEPLYGARGIAYILIEIVV